jgi:methionyl-tRNA formyltransferase
VPVAVYTQPDRPSGRGKKIAPSPVKKLAEANNIPVYQPASLKTAQAQAEFAALKLDLLIVVAYGLILPAEILNAPTHGCINVHASLLPRWRGAAPIERAILAGDKKTGVTIMAMDEGLDTGKMIHKVEVEIVTTDTRQDLEDKLIVAGGIGLLHTLGNIQIAIAAAQAQNDEESTYAAKLDKTEALLAFSLSAEQIDRVIRAGIGRQPGYCFYNRERVRFLRATPSTRVFTQTPGTIVDVAKDNITVACHESSLHISSIQLPGKNPVAIKDLRNSRPDYFRIGSFFTSAESSA